MQSDLVRARLSEGLPVWFRREAYHLAPDRRPLWHVVERVADVGRGRDERRVWTAVCGYEHAFNWWLLNQKPDTRADVKTKSIRCSKCTAVLAERFRNEKE